MWYLGIYTLSEGKQLERKALYTFATEAQLDNAICEFEVGEYADTSEVTYHFLADWGNAPRETVRTFYPEPLR